jgi:uncharacterized protein (DUF2235 family)
VIDIYGFCCEIISLATASIVSGFDRGAFTIRIVAGMIVAGAGDI